MFERGLTFAKELGPRGTALTMLGIATFLTAHPEVAPAATLLLGLSERLCDRYREQATGNWRWFERTLTVCRQAPARAVPQVQPNGRQLRLPGRPRE